MTDSSSAGGMTLGEERAAGCPIKPCRGADDNETMLRSIRSDRLLCLYCATRTPTGYIGREEARATENRFFKATHTDYAVQFAVSLVGSGIAGAIASLLGVLLFVFFIGAAAGGAIATLARRLSGRRLGRYSAEISVAGAVVGALGAPVALTLLRTGQFIPQAAVNLNALVCAAVISVAMWAVMKGRI
ncbi:MAG: hypothetical protein L6Q98_00170 [Anaerolineae bacterium]|nr:hypothetical protein [Anaerolineae bacterium]NUQ04966.1 hypothetical protein [Anaerolineae bacterium]